MIHMTRFKFNPRMAILKRRRVNGYPRALDHNHRTKRRFTVFLQPRSFQIGKTLRRGMSRISTTLGRASRTLGTWVVRQYAKLTLWKSSWGG